MAAAVRLRLLLWLRLSDSTKESKVFDDSEVEAEAVVAPLEIPAAAAETAKEMFFDDLEAAAEETLFVGFAAASTDGT